MNRNQCHFMLAEEGVPGMVRDAIYDRDDRLEVRDLSTRASVIIRAAEVSIYRHTLFLRGRAFRILNVVMPS